jgi:hypothetical protein
MSEHMDEREKLTAIARLKALGTEMDAHADYLAKMQGDVLSRWLLIGRRTGDKNSDSRRIKIREENTGGRDGRCVQTAFPDSD